MGMRMRTEDFLSPSAARRSHRGGIRERLAGSSPSDLAGAARSSRPPGSRAVPCAPAGAGSRAPGTAGKDRECERRDDGGGRKGSDGGDQQSHPRSGGGGPGVEGARAKVTPAWPRLRLGPRLWERGQKVAPLEKPAQGGGNGFLHPRSTGHSLSASGWAWGTGDARRGGLGAPHLAFPRAQGTPPAAALVRLAFQSAQQI